MAVLTPFSQVAHAKNASKTISMANPGTSSFPTYIMEAHPDLQNPDLDNHCNEGIDPTNEETLPNIERKPDGTCTPIIPLKVDNENPSDESVDKYPLDRTDQ